MTPGPGQIDVGGWDLLPWAAALHAVLLSTAVAIAIARLRATIPPPARWVPVAAGAGAAATLLLAAVLRLAAPRAASTLVSTFGPLLGLVVSTLAAGLVVSLVERQWATGVATALLGLALALAAAPLSFLSNPGDWPQSRSLADALLNPSLLPLLVQRAGGITALCGTCLLVCAIRGGDLQRPRAFAAGAILAVSGAAALAVGGGLWLRAAGPLPLASLAGEPGLLASALPVATWGVLIFAVLAILVALVSRFRAQQGRRGAVALLLPAVVAFVGAVEVARVALSGPWSVGLPGQGWLYANGLTARETAAALGSGLASVMPAVGPAGARPSAERGALVATAVCAPCHSGSGLSGRLDGWPATAIAAAVARLDRLSAGCPPFPGTAADARDLAAHLALLDGRPEGAMAPPDPVSIRAGRKAFERTCAHCHREIRLERRVAGFNEPLARRVVERLPRMSPAMREVVPPPEERAALAAYLVTLAR
jgi:cytochrome c5